MFPNVIYTSALCSYLKIQMAVGVLNKSSSQFYPNFKVLKTGNSKMTPEYWYLKKILDLDFHSHVLPSEMTFDCPKNLAEKFCRDCPAQNFLLSLHLYLIFSMGKPNTFGKIESVNKVFWFWYWQQLKIFFYE